MRLRFWANSRRVICEETPTGLQKSSTTQHSLGIHPKPSFVVDISEQIEAKMQAIGCYESQFVTGSRRIPDAAGRHSRRRTVLGMGIGAHCGEPFVNREEIDKSLEHLA